jgi:hypothetical protein
MPIAGHSEMRVDRTTVVEVQQLMLAASLDSTHAGTDDGTQSRRTDASAKARVKDPHATDRATLGGRTQYANGRFDLGKLGHETDRERRSVVPAIAPVMQRLAVVSQSRAR